MTAKAAALTDSLSAPPSSVGRLRSILGGSLGNLVEWYDWYAYTAFSVYFAGIFFPEGDRTAQLLGTAAIFGVGFLMRPVGAWLMGAYCDRHGRKAGLALSVLMMGGGSLLIAFTPGHASIGVAAPLILLIARLVQGLSIGGEYGASATYLSEMATRARRGFWSSFQYVTLIAGQLVALGVQLLLQALLTEADLQAWGWRIPFLVGAMLSVIVFLVRRTLAETQDFQERDPAKTSGALALLREHPGTALLVVVLTAGGTLAFYAYTTYMQKYLVNTAGYERQTATRIMTAALAVYMLLQPVVGALSDRIGRRPLLIIFGAGTALATVPLFTLIGRGGDPFAAFALIMAGLVLVSGYTAINAIVKAELFPAHIRALGVALPYAIANALFGGSAEYVALWFKQAGQEPLFFWYVSGMAALSLLAYLRMRETQRHGTMTA